MPISKVPFLRHLACLIILSVLAKATEPGFTPSDAAPTYSLHHWGQAQGLMDTRVLAIARTNDGFLWLGTSGGLYRFDGVRFVRIQFSSTPARQHEVSALQVDQAGALWIGTIGDGLVRMRDGVFTSYDTVSGLPDKSVRSMSLGADGTLWIATPLGLVSHRNGTFRTYNSKDGLTRDFVASLCANTKTGLIVSSGGKIHRLEGDRLVVLNNLVHPEDGRLDALFSASDGSIWITFEDSVVKRWDGGDSLQVYTHKHGLSSRTSVIFEDAQHNIWAGCRLGLRKFNGHFFEDFREVDPEIGRGQVKSALCDRDGSMWVGFESEGLVRIRNGIAKKLTTKQGLPDNSTRCLMQSSDGALWIGTTNGLARVKNGVTETITECQDYPIPTVTTITEGPDGRMWVGAGGRIIIIDGPYRYWHPEWKNVYDIKALCFDRKGGVYVGTDGEGLWTQADHQSLGRFEKDTRVASRQIRALYVDPRDRLWVGTAGDGAFIVDGKTATHLSISERNSDNDRVYKFTEEANGALWMATRNGLCLYEGGRVRMLGHQDGVPEGLLFGIADDGGGYLWISGNHGISRLPQAELLLRAHGQGDPVKPWTLSNDDGVTPGPYSQGVVFKNPNGKHPHLVFGGLAGVIIISPEKHIPAPPPPQALIDQLIINRKTVQITENIEIAPGEGSVEVHYTSPDLAEPEHTAFSYKLEGVDTEWVNGGTRRYAHYANVAPGNYRFMLRVAREHESFEAAPISIRFTLEPHFYQSPGLRLLGIASLVGLFCAGYSIRIRRLKAREKELQRRVDEALANVKVLKGLVPVCASCKKIRDDQGYWNNVDQFLRQHAEAQISHGICPDCAMHLYPELGHDLIMKLSQPDGGEDSGVKK